MQDITDAERSSTSSSPLAPQKRKPDEKDIANPKTLLWEEKCLTSDDNIGSDAVTENSSSDITGYNDSMRGHVEQCVSKCLELADRKVSELRQCGTPCNDDHDVTDDDLEAGGDLADASARIVLRA